MTHITLNLTGKFMPIDRGDMFEDPLHEFLRSKEYGIVDGGGSALQANGEIDTVDVEIYLNDGVDVSKVIDDMTEFLNQEVGVPKGSKWILEDKKIELGEYEGLGMYFNVEPDKVNVEELQNILNDSFAILGEKVLYTSNRLNDNVTVIYYYGGSYDEMERILSDFMKEKYSHLDIIFKQL